MINNSRTFQIKALIIYLPSGDNASRSERDYKTYYDDESHKIAETMFKDNLELPDYEPWPICSFDNPPLLPPNTFIFYL